MVQRMSLTKAKTLLLAAASFLWPDCHAQYAWQHGAAAGEMLPFSDIHYEAELQGSFSSGTTPLWLNANKHGLGSLERDNGYLRGALCRPLSADSARRWGLGYGVDAAVASHYASRFIVQQAYVEGRWLHGVLTIGAKEWPMELKNQRLSSGSQALGINARPVPQVRIAVPEYWTIPALGRWFAVKVHVAYGLFTDQRWQRQFTNGGATPYNENVLYHSKAGYLRIGKPGEKPLAVELGLEMQAQFAGSKVALSDGKLTRMKLGGKGIKDFWRVFIPSGSDITDGLGYGNIEGNQSGAWLARVSYDKPSWGVSVYADHYFEDHSQQFHLDFDGYGDGADYQKRVSHRYLLYPLKDILLGGELRLKRCQWLKGVVVEYLHTTYQSGPVYHDRTSTIPDHIGGRDNYYNHGNYMCVQHWGQVMGNPLYRSPAYNANHTLRVEDNRFVAWHMGVEGTPVPRLGYRLLVSWQRGYGTYNEPYTYPHHNTSVLAEAEYGFGKGWTVRWALGMDRGSLLGNNRGLQLTICKRGLLR